MIELNENPKDFSSSALLAEMMEKGCSPERQEEILALLDEVKETSEAALWDYARGLAFRVNRVSDWEIRLSRLELLRRIALRAGGPHDLRVAYAQAVFHRMNAETDTREMFKAGEQLVELSRSEMAEPEIDAICACAVLNRLRISPDLTRKREDARFLYELTERENALPRTWTAAVKGFVFLLKAEHEIEKKETVLKSLDNLFCSSGKYPEITVAYAQALEYAVQVSFSPEKKLRIVDTLQELDHSLKSDVNREFAAVWEICAKERSEWEKARVAVRNSLSNAFAYLVASEKNPVQQCAFLAALKTEILQNRSYACFREAYARGIASALLRQNSRHQLYLLEEARKLAEADDRTDEISVQYAAAMLCRLFCSEDAGEIAELLTRIANYFTQNPNSADFHCLYASAILLTMRWEPVPEKRKVRVQLLENWRSVYRTRFADLFRMCRNEFLEYETDAEVRRTVLDSIR
ncbi:MAG: hypothetical protein E7028_09415 [Planctomycetaceae bacterium]|nr:hypothetical protein [Planctomycetaceae bacterium]